MSQFIEMFGDRSTTPVGNYIKDSFPGDWGKEDKDGTGVKVIRTTNFTNTGKLNLSEVVTRSIEERKIQKKRIQKYDIILERSGGTADNPVGRVVLFEENEQYLCNNFTQVLRFKDIDSRFAFYALYYFYQTNKNAIRSMGSKTTGIQNLNMSKYLEIGIPNADKEEQLQFVTIVEQADKSKFGDFKSQFIEMFGSPFENNSEMVPLSSLCLINPSKPKGLDDSLSVSFIPMDRISEDGEYTEFETKLLKDVKKGFTFCAEDDVLFAKITPCMENGKGAILKGLSNGIGFGSTEFHVLRPISGITNSEWLYFLTKLSGFRLDAAKNMTGTGGQKRVPSSYLLNFKVMRPQLVAQKEFAEIVRQADKSKSVIQKALVYLNDIQSDELGKIA